MISVGTGEGSSAGWEENGLVVLMVSRVRLGRISGGYSGCQGISNNRQWSRWTCSWLGMMFVVAVLSQQCRAINRTGGGGWSYGRRGENVDVGDGGISHHNILVERTRQRSLTKSVLDTT
jgi:hypothetical protein